MSDSVTLIYLGEKLEMMQQVYLVFAWNLFCITSPSDSLHMVIQGATREIAAEYFDAWVEAHSNWEKYQLIEIDFDTLQADLVREY